MEGVSLTREEPVMWLRNEHAQAGDQRLPRGLGGNRVMTGSVAIALIASPTWGRVQGAGCRLVFESGDRQNPETRHYQANPLPPQGDVHALIRGLEAKYDAVLHGPRLRRSSSAPTQPSLHV
jgi:hypothetical protein